MYYLSLYYEFVLQSVDINTEMLGQKQHYFIIMLLLLVG
jgi:hypothetical protein